MQAEDRAKDVAVLSPRKAEGNLLKVGYHLAALHPAQSSPATAIRIASRYLMK